MNLDFIPIVTNLGIINNALHANNSLIIHILLIYMNKKKLDEVIGPLRKICLIILKA